MKIIEMNGRNVEDAIKNALAELKLTADKVSIEVIDAGNKGLFNLIGFKPSKIRVTVKRDYIEEARVFLTDVLKAMNILAEIKIIEVEDVVKIALTGPDMGIMIGYRGETLDSLQYLVSLLINKGKDEKYKRVVLDTENYRAKREDTLRRLALKVASKVKTTGKYLKLEPMNPYERRIIHASLQGDPNIDTYSEGDEPFRRIVVDLKKA